MKRLLAIATIAALGILAAVAQEQQIQFVTATNPAPPAVALTNPPPLVGVFGQLGQFLAGAGTNLIGVGYGIYSSGDKSAGGGVALAYELNPYAVSAFRVDYLNKEFYQGTITMQLQLPIRPASWCTLYPFGVAGASVAR